MGSLPKSTGSCPNFQGSWGLHSVFSWFEWSLIKSCKDNSRGKVWQVGPLVGVESRVVLLPPSIGMFGNTPTSGALESGILAWTGGKFYCWLSVCLRRQMSRDCNCKVLRVGSRWRPSYCLVDSSQETKRENRSQGSAHLKAHFPRPTRRHLFGPTGHQVDRFGDPGENT